MATRFQRKAGFLPASHFIRWGLGVWTWTFMAQHKRTDGRIRGPFDLILTSLLETLDFKELDFSTFTPKTRSLLPLEARTEKLPSALTLHYENFHTCRKVEKIMQSNPFPLHLDLRARFLSLYLLISFFLIHFKVSCKCPYTLLLNT